MSKYILLFILLFFPISINALSLDKCIDGDTFKLNDNGKIITIRLLAVDTPELSKEDYFSYQAKDYTCELLTNAKEIKLEKDPLADMDKYGRYLRWVYVDYNLLQAVLVSKGYARVAYIYDDYMHVDYLYKLETEARKNKLGIWQEENKIITILLLVITIIIVLNKLLSKLKRLR